MYLISERRANVCAFILDIISLNLDLAQINPLGHYYTKIGLYTTTSKVLSFRYPNKKVEKLVQNVRSQYYYKDDTVEAIGMIEQK